MKLSKLIEVLQWTLENGDREVFLFDDEDKKFHKIMCGDIFPGFSPPAKEFSEEDIFFNEEEACGNKALFIQP